MEWGFWNLWEVLLGKEGWEWEMVKKDRWGERGRGKEEGGLRELRKRVYECKKRDI